MVPASSALIIYMFREGESGPKIMPSLIKKRNPVA